MPTKTSTTISNIVTRLPHLKFSLVSLYRPKNYVATMLGSLAKDRLVQAASLLRTILPTRGINVCNVSAYRLSFGDSGRVSVSLLQLAYHLWLDPMRSLLSLEAISSDWAMSAGKGLPAQQKRPLRYTENFRSSAGVHGVCTRADRLGSQHALGCKLLERRSRRT
jgi:hypothetical protein